MVIDKEEEMKKIIVLILIVVFLLFSFGGMVIAGDRVRNCNECDPIGDGVKHGPGPAPNSHDGFPDGPGWDN